jgi:hypothetical protein
MIKLETVKRFISTNDISFLRDLDKTIDVDKKGKAYYFKMYGINKEEIDNFILNLDDDKIYLVNPLVSRHAKYSDPYINLSRQFLVSVHIIKAVIHFKNLQ